MATKVKKELPPGVPAGEGGGPLPAAEVAPPKFGTPQPAAAGELPRVIDPLDRATAGTVRYKVRCNNYHPYGLTEYLLARPGDDEAVRECYLTHRGIRKELDKLAKAGVEKPEQPDLVMYALPD